MMKYFVSFVLMTMFSFNLAQEMAFGSQEPVVTYEELLLGQVHTTVVNPSPVAVLPNVVTPVSSSYAQVAFTPNYVITNPVNTAPWIKVWSHKDPYQGGSTQIYRGGEELKIYVSSSQNTYIHLFILQSDNTVTQILPNAAAGGTDNFVAAGTTKLFPTPGASYGMRIGPPYGTDRILAVASNSPLPQTFYSYLFPGPLVNGYYVATQPTFIQFGQVLMDSLVQAAVPVGGWVTATTAIITQP